MVTLVLEVVVYIEVVQKLGLGVQILTEKDFGQVSNRDYRLPKSPPYMLIRSIIDNSHINI